AHLQSPRREKRAPAGLSDCVTVPAGVADFHCDELGRILEGKNKHKTWYTKGEGDERVGTMEIRGKTTLSGVFCACHGNRYIVSRCIFAEALHICAFIIWSKYGDVYPFLGIDHYENQLLPFNSQTRIIKSSKRTSIFYNGCWNNCLRNAIVLVISIYARRRHHVGRCTNTLVVYHVCFLYCCHCTSRKTKHR